MRTCLPRDSDVFVPLPYNDGIPWKRPKGLP
jgi:hypothetical protein